MKLLVTGAAGFIGAACCARAVAAGHQVVGLDNVNDYYDVRLKHYRLAQLGLHRVPEAGSWSESASGLRFLRADICDEAALEQLFASEGFDAVVHLAAQAGVRFSLERPQSYVESNIRGFVALLETLRRHPVSHFLYASSSSVYGNDPTVPLTVAARADEPQSLYAATKRAGELIMQSYCSLFPMAATGLRFFTVYGPAGRPDMAPLRFARAILLGETISLYNHGNLSRDFTYVDDIVEGILRLLPLPPEGKPAHRVLNLGAGRPTQLLTFVEELERALGRKAQRRLVDHQPGDVYRTWADTTELEALTGFRPQVTLAEGLGAVAAWLREFDITAIDAA